LDNRNKRYYFYWNKSSIYSWNIYSWKFYNIT
jgi:hypothetical protein